jgi:DNA mismatch endonuclease (patch repair protein)
LRIRTVSQNSGRPLAGREIRKETKEKVQIGKRNRWLSLVLPGKSDIVFVQARVVVFLDGDFWHGYRFPQWEKTLGKFWRKRDQRNFARLRRMGWRVIRIWEHSIEKDLDVVVERIVRALD